MYFTSPVTICRMNSVSLRKVYYSQQSIGFWTCPQSGTTIRTHSSETYLLPFSGGRVIRQLSSIFSATEPNQVCAPWTSHLTMKQASWNILCSEDLVADKLQAYSNHRHSLFMKMISHPYANACPTRYRAKLKSGLECSGALALEELLHSIMCNCLMKSV
jgi:hypothetical protein